MVLQDLLLSLPVKCECVTGITEALGPGWPCLSLLSRSTICSWSQPRVTGWSCFHLCFDALPSDCHTASPVGPRATAEVWTLHFPWNGVFGLHKYPKHQKDSLFSLWPAILTSCSFKSPGVLIVTITHLAELLIGLPVGIESEGFFSSLGGAATPNCQSNGGLYWCHRGPLSPQFVPVTLGTCQKTQLPLCCPKTLPGRVSHCREGNQEINADTIGLNVPANIPWVCGGWCCLCSCHFPTQWSSSPWNTLTWLEGRGRVPIPRLASNHLFCSISIQIFWIRLPTELPVCWVRVPDECFAVWSKPFDISMLIMPGTRIF